MGKGYYFISAELCVNQLQGVLDEIVNLVHNKTFDIIK